MRRVIQMLAGAAALVSVVARANWPQFLGPTRDGVYHGPRLSTNWPGSGPAANWKISVGQGFSAPIVSSNGVYLFQRQDNREIIDAYNRQTGRSLWTHGYAATYQDDFGFDEGPRSTPCIANGKLFAYGAGGILTALDVAVGKQLWTVDTVTKFGSRKGWFGRAPSPLAVRDIVLVHVGGASGAGIVAFRQADGSVAWKSTEDEASYASPTVAKFGNDERALFLTRKRLVAVDPATGQLSGSFPFAPSMDASVVAATPLVLSNAVFISASYGVGSALLDYAAGKFTPRWESEGSMANHYATSVLHDGAVYGFHGRQEEKPSLACFDLRTGKLHWEVERFGAGTLILAHGHLLILTEQGELILAPASAAKFTELHRAQILGFGVRAHAALSEGRLYARDKDKLVSIDLLAKAP